MFSTRILMLLVSCLTIAVVLAATNPSRDDYDAFLEAIVTQAVERRAQEVPQQQGEMMHGLLQSLLKPIMQSLIHPNTIRRDYGVFSIFETRVLESRVVVLGIGTKLIPLRGVEEIIQKLGRLAPKANPGP